MVLELPYDGRDFYEIEICGLKRKLPVRRVSEDLYIASNHDLVLGCDIEFTKRVGEELAEKIKKSGKNPEVLFTAEAKALPFVYEVAKNLGHEKIAVARKSKKDYMEEPIGTKMKSITTEGEQDLVLDRANQEKIEGRRVCLIDDVVSTGKTIDTLEEFTNRLNGKVACRAAIWLEGENYSKDLIYLDELPLFRGK